MPNSSIIYKFRTWSDSNHKDLLLKNHLFYASPKHINDPFDFKITYDFSILDTQVKKIKFIDDLLKQASETIKQNNINVNQKKLELLHRFENESEKFQDEYSSHESEWINNRFGVISFSLKWNKILLWSHYAQNHKGFCVGFNKKKFETSILIGTAGPVNYRKLYPKIDPLNTDKLEEIYTKSHTKSTEWSYEKEYRITQIWPYNTPTKDQRILTVPQDFFEEVILGLNIEEKDEVEIIQKSRELNLPIFKIIKKRNSYTLDRIKI